MPLIHEDQINRSHQLLIRNRRKRYLDLHPEYFSTLESANPLLYDRLIRRHQTPAERDHERRQKGFAATLEADLERSEAKLDEARTGDVTEDDGLTREEAYQQWRWVMERRFLDGDDAEFDYAAVDGDDGLDDVWERERQEEWFEMEEEGEHGTDTGVQDF